MRARWAVGVFGAALGAGFACGDFRSAGGPADGQDGGAEGGLADAPGNDEAQTTSDAPVDAADAARGDSPPDFQCTEPWTKPNRTQSGCEPRRVVVLEPGILDTTTVSIAVTGTNRVGVAYNSKLFADQGELHIAHFGRPAAPPASPDGGLVPAPQIAVIARTQFDNVGFVAHIAAAGPARLHVAYQTVPDNEIDYATLETTGPPSAPEVISTGISQASHIALGVLPSGDVRVAYFDPGKQTLFSKLRTTTAGWAAAPSTIHAGFTPDAGIPGIGHVVEVIDDVGSAHVAYHHASFSGASGARYSQFGDPLWGDSKTLENLPGASAGFSIALGLTGQTRRAAYFVVPQGSKDADLRLASWVSINDTPMIEVLDQQIPTSADPSYQVAMATDAYGLIHLAIVRPEAGNSGILSYQRQKRVAGSVTWVSDVVDDNVLATGSAHTLVDIAVDKDGRPHIAYYRGTDLAVCYATRFDRP